MSSVTLFNSEDKRVLKEISWRNRISFSQYIRRCCCQVSAEEEGSRNDAYHLIFTALKTSIILCADLMRGLLDWRHQHGNLSLLLTIWQSVCVLSQTSAL